jgi:hypothetical protein
MLALCRRKAAGTGLSPNVYEQYLERLDLPRRHRTILIPSSSLQLITRPSDADEALRRVRDHLLPGGAVAATMLTFRGKDGGVPQPAEWEKSAVRAGDGATFRRASKWRFDPADGCDHTEDLYQKIVGGEVVAEELHRRSPATRSYTVDAARDLFERAGFAEVQIYSGFTFDLAKPEEDGFTVVGEKAASQAEGRDRTTSLVP